MSSEADKARELAELRARIEAHVAAVERLGAQFDRLATLVERVVTVVEEVRQALPGATATEVRGSTRELTDVRFVGGVLDGKFAERLVVHHRGWGGAWGFTVGDGSHVSEYVLDTTPAPGASVGPTRHILRALPEVPH